MKLAVLGLCMAACGSSPPASPDASAPADAMPAADGGVTTLHGTINDTGKHPLAGATLCVLDHPDLACATTGADGAWQLQLPVPPSAQLAFEASATGYLGQVVLETESMDVVTWPSDFYLQTDAEAAAELNAKAGFTFPGEGTGFLVLQVDGATAGSLSGATVSIDTTFAKGPVYYDASGPNPSLTGTTTAAYGGVVFGDVAPGRHGITVTAAGKTCTVKPGGGNVIAGDWAPSGANTADVEIAADAETRSVLVSCL